MEKNISDMNTLAFYLSEINKIDLLKREEEIELATKAQAGDMAARDKLVKSHLRFVVNVAKKFQNQGMSLEDLISEGNIGILLAIEKYDVSQGFHFISYAVWWIRQSMLKALGEKARMVRLPQNRAIDLLHVEKAKKILEGEGKRVNADVISQMTGIKLNIVKDLMLITNQALSLNSPINSDSDSASNLEDFISADQYKNPDNEYEHSELKKELDFAMEILDNKEVRILEYRYGLNGKKEMSLREIGIKLNLSKERVRQIEQKAISRLRHPSRKVRLESFMAS